MIIISQDKETIINFESITRISIIPPVEQEYKYSIAINGCLDLGYYKTKERAKEVLQEIYKNYADFELIRCINDNFQQQLIVGNKNKYFDIYEMPED